MANASDALLHGDLLPVVVWRFPGGGELSLTDLPVINCLGRGPTIGRAVYCAGEGEFVFSIDLFHLPTGIAVLRLGAEDDPFVGPTERIAVNFDSSTGDITAPAVVEPVGSPTRDCWQDGELASFSLTNLGAGAWRLDGIVADGSEPLSGGEELAQLKLRTSSFSEVTELGLPITTCGVANGKMSWGSLKSRYGPDR